MSDVNEVMASHTHAMPDYVVGGDFVLDSQVRVGRDTFAVIDGAIHRYHGLFWRPGTDEEIPVSIGCHTVNCDAHPHWEKVISATPSTAMPIKRQ